MYLFPTAFRTGKMPAKSNSYPLQSMVARSDVSFTGTESARANMIDKSLARSRTSSNIASNLSISLSEDESEDERGNDDYVGTKMEGVSARKRKTAGKILVKNLFDGQL